MQKIKTTSSVRSIGDGFSFVMVARNAKLKFVKKEIFSQNYDFLASLFFLNRKGPLKGDFEKTRFVKNDVSWAGDAKLERERES